MHALSTRRVARHHTTPTVRPGCRRGPTMVARAVAPRVGCSRLHPTEIRLHRAKGPRHGREGEAFNRDSSLCPSRGTSFLQTLWGQQMARSWSCRWHSAGSGLSLLWQLCPFNPLETALKRPSYTTLTSGDCFYSAYCLAVAHPMCVSPLLASVERRRKARVARG